MHRLLKKAWPGKEATISSEVQCYHYSIDTVIEFRSQAKNQHMTSSKATNALSKKNSFLRGNKIEVQADTSHEVITAPPPPLVALEIGNKYTKEFRSGFARPESRLRRRVIQQAPHKYLYVELDTEELAHDWFTLESEAKKVSLLKEFVES